MNDSAAALCAADIKGQNIGRFIFHQGSRIPWSHWVLFNSPRWLV
jgi:hypothetical protein